MLRLVDAGTPTFATTGGAYTVREYGYDGRGNRTGQTNEDCSYAATYAATPHVDEETKQASSCASSILAESYAYDLDGRVSSKNWENDSSGSAAYQLTFTSGDSTSTSNGALDTVFKSVSVNGAIYNYWYDASNRRRQKTYPTGPTDEYFHDLGNQMLVDQGNSAITSPTAFPEDDYVWLGGRPVVIVRGQMSTAWARQSDATANCQRNSDAAACGFYFPVTDHIGKPVLMLNASRAVAGTADYDPFGHANRVTLDKETVHPYANSTSSTIADFTQKPGTSSAVSMRVLFQLVDTESNAGTPLDFVQLSDGDNSTVFTGNYGGNHAGQMWSSWVTPSAGHVKAKFTSNSTNCCPNGTSGLNCTVGTCSQYPNYPYTGVVIAGYEYRRTQTSTSWFWTPLRFPGQYYDSETDLIQNWNRFYSPDIGRYLESEPIAAWPQAYKLSAKRGTGLPAYSYAVNNPLHFRDVDGRWACADPTEIICWLWVPLDPLLPILFYPPFMCQADPTNPICAVLFPQPPGLPPSPPTPGPTPAPGPGSGAGSSTGAGSSPGGFGAPAEPSPFCGDDSLAPTCHELEESGYEYSSPEDAMKLFPGCTKKKPTPHETGICAGESGHYNVISRDGDRAGSIVCCSCCDGPVFSRRCGDR